MRAGLFGFIGDGLALWRPTTGCAVVPDGNLEFAARVGAAAASSASTASNASTASSTSTATNAGATAPAAPGAATGAGAEAEWPHGNAVATNAALNRLLADDALAGPGVRAIVVVDHGRIVATFPDAGRDWEALFKGADAALYASKRGGRNRSTAWATLRKTSAA